MPTWNYPPARTVDHADDYHGTLVPDPYRWLEDMQSKEVLAWAKAQTNLAESALRGGVWEEVRARVEQLADYPKVGMPRRSIVRQRTPDAEREAVLDVNSLSADGTVAVPVYSVSPDGKTLAYAVADGGSDWNDVRFRDVSSGQDLPDQLTRTRYATLGWLADSSGFYYARYPDHTGEAMREGQIFFHRMGTAQADDILVYHLPDRPAMNPTPTLTDDGAYIVVSAWQHLNGNSITVLPINPPGAPVTLIESDDYEVNFAGNVGERFYFTTNHAAPRGRVIAVDLSAAGVEQEIIPQFDDAILTGYSGGAAVCGGKLVVRTMQDVTSRLAIYTLDGQHERDITLPTLGNIPMMTIIDQADPDFYFYFESFAYPPTIFRCEVATGALQIIHQPKTLIDPASITVEQVFYPSKDGTRIPMFLVYRKGLQKDGQVPVYINAYGGFSIAMQPGFAPTPWLEMGGVLAIPGLRGGGEYGEEWHQAGMFERKQNVFDDLHAAAEYLIREGWTHSGRIGIKGGSNGGLLTSAAITQRPDLYGAAVVGVPLTDMLRFQHFTIARFWVPEYGSSEDPAQFEYLLKYSPLHNIKPGTAYPPTFIQTGAGDNRVVPAHAYKFAAAMQAAQASDAPILMHVEMRAGHGIGKPLSLQLDDATDQIVFFMQAFGMAKS
ncbi:MAG: prolyl oligopeptidase family serine peptidase [Anaerolineae bacterium]|nr:prolyl oligopeptidase family serine peptidase [Anaerolineae bacterium]